MYDLSVLVEPLDGAGFRASSGEPFRASTVGTSREEAVHRLREVLELRMRAGAEVVRLRIDDGQHEPIWPDDDLTKMWLEGIAEARAKSDAMDLQS